MDVLKRKRTVMRTGVTKALNSLHALLESTEASTTDISVAFRFLSDKYKELEDNDGQLLDAMIEGEVFEASLQKDIDESDAYKTRFLAAKHQFDAMMTARNGRSQKVSQVHAASNSVNAVEAKKSYNLPPLKLERFSGNVREWLQFWSSFKKVHEDQVFANEDKFQYLIQAMVPDSRAAELVRSYPPTCDNYVKAIESLKRRFGRDYMQIEVYVRELLQLVLQNALSTKEVELSTLYDKIESYLRALETLGVTTDLCAAMLYPLVESSLPEDLLRAWQRSNSASEMSVAPNSVVTGNAAAAPNNVSKNRLNKLIAFLEAEVQNELRITMAMKGFSIKHSETEQVKKLKGQASGKDIPSARNLLSSKAKGIPCIFCEKTDHDSAKCEKAKKLTLSERQKIVKEKHACFKCMKVGHGSRFCRVNVRCSLCSRYHPDLMCFGDDNKNKSDEKPLNSVSGISVQQKCSLATSDSRPSTFMQTLKVRLRNDDKEIVVRAVIDTGSQNSYILKNVAESMYKPTAKQDIVHLLFGGDKSGITSHNKYLVRAGTIQGGYWCNFEAMDEAIICADVPTITQGQWLEELKDMGIKLSDVESEESSVSLLLGADIAGKLFTGRVRALKSGLPAMEHTWAGR